MMTDFALVVSLDDSFSQTEAPEVCAEFVCAVCHGDLHIVFVPNELRVLIVCFEHGNICDCGRVTRNTVSIEIEKGIKTFYAAVMALADLWPDVIERGWDRTHAINFAKAYVCQVCGGTLIPSMTTNNKYNVACPQHGIIQICGHVKRENFIYDFQRIRAWEKSHRRTF